jgi:hypothetical protein
MTQDTPNKLHTDERQFVLSLAQAFNDNVPGVVLVERARAFIRRAKTPQRQAVRALAIDLFHLECVAAAILAVERLG